MIEALVSLVLISSVGLSLYAWVNVNLISLQRVKSINAQYDDMSKALAMVANINPMEQPQGHLTYKDWDLSWQAQSIYPIKDNIGYPDGVGIYQVGLFQLTVRVMRHEKETSHFDLLQMGYKQVRNPIDAI